MTREGMQARWVNFWMRFGGLTPSGRVATRLATWIAPPYKGLREVARLYPHGYVSPSASIAHRDLRLGQYVFIGERVVIFDGGRGGPVQLGDRVDLHRDVIIESGDGGSLTIGPDSRVQSGCLLMAYRAPIEIGRDVGIAQYCALFPYDHGFEPGLPISRQPITTRGPIVIGDHAWLGVRVVVLSGVRIGRGAVIGAGSIVTRDVPDDAVAVGAPARIVGRRDALAKLGSPSAADEREQNESRAR